MAALTWSGLTNPSNASAATIDRVKADATGCDTSATTAPCFDVGNTFATTATATAISSATLTFNGLTAHTMPISAGQAVSCSGCTTGLFVALCPILRRRTRGLGWVRSARPTTVSLSC